MSRADRLKALQLVTGNAIYHYGSRRRTMNAVCLRISRAVTDVTCCTTARCGLCVSMEQVMGECGQVYDGEQTGKFFDRATTCKSR